KRAISSRSLDAFSSMRLLPCLIRTDASSPCGRGLRRSLSRLGPMVRSRTSVRGIQLAQYVRSTRRMRAMGDRSTIEWTEATWNPVTGCDRVSPGCDHCYALTLAARLKAMGSPKYQHDGDPRTSGPGFGVRLHPDELI